MGVGECVFPIRPHLAIQTLTLILSCMQTVPDRQEVMLSVAVYADNLLNAGEGDTEPSTGTTVGAPQPWPLGLLFRAARVLRRVFPPLYRCLRTVVVWCMTFLAHDVTVPATTISQVIKEEGLDRIDLLKIDVERAELDVLASVQPSDWDVIQAVVLEAHDTNGALSQMVSLLETYDFEVVIEEDPLLVGTGLYVIYATRDHRRTSLTQ
jgi:hypothetical protein